jgi:hypothetical protein
LFSSFTLVVKRVEEKEAMKILMNPVVQKQMVTEDESSFHMLLDIINVHKETPADVILCLKKYLDTQHEIPVGYLC